MVRSKNKSLEEHLEQIEEEVQDGMAMFLEFGEEYFSLEELEGFYFHWERKYLKEEKVRQQFALVAISSLVLIPIAGIVLISGYANYLPLFYVCFPIVFILGLVGFMMLYFREGGVVYQENVGRQLKIAIRSKLKKLGFFKDFDIN